MQNIVLFLIQELAAQRQQLCPSVPPKLRKRSFPRCALFDTFGCAKPVCFKQEGISQAHMFVNIPNIIIF